jgi:hypothetical protein
MTILCGQYTVLTPVGVVAKSVYCLRYVLPRVSLSLCLHV